MSGDFEQLLSVTKRWVSTYKGRASVKAESEGARQALAPAFERGV